MNIQSYPTITKNNTTKYAGIDISVYIIFLFLLFIKCLTDIATAITITNANIIYPHNCTVASTLPAPVNSVPLLNVKNFPVTIFCVFNIVCMPTITAKITTFLKIFLINLLCLNKSLSIALK